MIGSAGARTADSNDPLLRTGHLSFPPVKPRPWGLVSAGLLCVAAIPLFPLRMLLIGYAMVVVALVVAAITDRYDRTDRILRDLICIAAGMVVVSTVSVAADISWPNFFKLGAVLAAAVAVPYLISRFIWRDRAISFPWRGGWPWSRTQWVYLVLVLVAGWLILPFYFITSRVYLNWPAVTEWHEVGRLFVGVNAVGIWDELFFICTVFVLLLRHFPVWQANLLQAIVFVSFLWELGYRAWGPLLTIPFALLQGWIFSRTRTLPYVIAVHLLFDLIVFLVIVHARNPGAIPIFLW